MGRFKKTDPIYTVYVPKGEKLMNTMLLVLSNDSVLGLDYLQLMYCWK